MSNLLTATQVANILNTQQAAAFLGVSENTLRTWIKSNSIPHRRVGRVIRFSVDALREWAKGSK